MGGGMRSTEALQCSCLLSHRNLRDTQRVSQSLLFGALQP
jgi:hypothetical protein